MSALISALAALALLPAAQPVQPSGERLDALLAQADLDGDGTTEIITIRSSVTHGASVTVYGVQDNKLVFRATTGFIGRANR